MKKALKILAVLVAIVAVVLIVSSVALHVMLPPEKARDLILKQLTRHLKREVRLGQASVGLMSGLSVTDLKVSESPDFSKGTFLSSGRFSVRVALIPLLFHRVEVKQLILDHPMINIVRLPDGKTFNFSDLMAADPAASTARSSPASAFALVPEAYAVEAGTPSGSEPPPFLLLISHAQVQNGIVHFIDQSPAKQSVDIDPLTLKLRNVSTTSPFSVQAFLKAKARKGVAELKLAGDADLAKGSFKIKQCVVSSGGSMISLSGKASQLKTPEPSADLDLEIKALKLATLAAFVSLPPALKIQEPIKGSAHIKGDEKKMDFNLQLALRSLQLKAHGKATELKSPQPQINLHVESNSFAVADLTSLIPSLRPNGMTLQGHGQVSADVSGTQSSSRLAAKLDAKDMDVSYADKFSKPAGVPMKVAVVGEVIQSPPLASSGKKAVKVPAKPPEQQVNFQNLTAHLGAIELNGSGSLWTTGSAPRMQLALKSNLVSLQEISKLVPWLAPYKLGGNAVLEIRASGTPEAPQANGSMALENASLHYEQSELSHVSTNLTFTQQDVSIPKLTGKLNGSDITLALTGRKLTTRPVVNAEATVAELDLDKLLPPVSPSSPAGSSRGSMDSPLTTAGNDGRGMIAVAWAADPPPPPMDVTGHLTVGKIKHEFYNAQNLDFKWDLKNITPDLALVSGSAALKQGPGVLKEVDRLVQRSKTARVALLPIQILQRLGKKGLLKSLGLPSLEQITFQGIRGDYLLRSGVMDIKAFELTGRELSVNTLGTVGLAGAQPLDLRVVMKLAPGIIRGTLGQIIGEGSGGAPLSFSVKGTLSNPDVKLLTAEITQKAVGKLGDLFLKGLGKGKSQEPPAQPPSAPESAPAPASSELAQPVAPNSPPPNPAKDLEKALKNIFK